MTDHHYSCGHAHEGDPVALACPTCDAETQSQTQRAIDGARWTAGQLRGLASKIEDHMSRWRAQSHDDRIDALNAESALDRYERRARTLGDTITRDEMLSLVRSWSAVPDRDNTRFRAEYARGLSTPYLLADHRARFLDAADYCALTQYVWSLCPVARGALALRVARTIDLGVQDTHIPLSTLLPLAQRLIALGPEV